MKKARGRNFGIVLAALLLVPVSVNAAVAPKVLKTVPANGDTAVNPHMKELRIEFDRAMDTRGGMSIVGGGDTFPKINGRPRWIGDRTLVVPLELKPDREYSLSVNSSRFRNFRGANGEPAVPYPVSFHTAAHGETMKGAALTLELNRRSVAQLRAAVAKNYSYRDRRRVDWGARFTEFESRLLAAKSKAEFAEGAAELLKVAEDVHIWIERDGKTVGTHQRSVRPNMDFRWLQRNVPKWRQLNRAVYTGDYPGGVRYILIATWSRGRAKELQAIHPLLDELAAGDKLILDLRANSGGDERIAREVAGRFIDKPVVYARNRNVDASLPGGFTRVFERTLEPRRGRKPFRGRIAVLMGPANMSSCEAFLLMMRRVPNATLFGERSYGASGNPKPTTLENGVTVFLPSWQAMDAEGEVFEGRGLEPDVPVEWKPGNSDPLIEEALRRWKEG